MSGALLRRSRVMWPEAWRSADRLLAEWVRLHGGSDALARWAGACAAAEGEGHTALGLADAARFGAPVDAREALDAPGWVGDGGTRTPFVREGDARLYLWRYWQAEHRVAAALGERIAGTGASTAALDGAALAALFGGPGDGRDAAQREAVRRCGTARLFVLTGGPGTGKTTTVLRMLLAYQHLQQRPLRVQVAAPTGKAAQRLVDALRAGLGHLTALASGGPWADTLATFAMPSASTVHRLLGYQPARHRYAHDALHPLSADLVVVDEASMLDLDALDALLAALPPDAALWLVGDADQLSPVGPGSAFQDLVQALATRPGAPMARLDHSFRADHALDALNRALRSGDAAAVSATLSASDAVQQAPLADGAAVEVAQRRWAAALPGDAPVARLPAQADAAAMVAAEALAQLRRRQWLCATREGPFGTVVANARFDALLRRASGAPARADGHYPGRRLLITRNDADTGLFNGDVGLCLADADGQLRAWFEGDGGPRALPLALLPPHEPAFALTVHKSQGSEYDRVAVVLPDDPEHRLLSRELLYTAASRARRQLTLHATGTVIAACLAQPVRRSGGLHARLAERLETAG